MKKYLNFLIAVLISLFIWMISNLSRQHSDVETVNVTVLSNIEGRKGTSYEEVQVSANCTATGFRLLRTTARKRVSIFVDGSQLSYLGGDMYAISQETLYKEASAIFGNGVSVNSLVTPRIVLRFQPENFKKVPVEPVCSISYASQYMPMGEMHLEPDSVLVYGEPSRLESVDRIFTRTIVGRDVRRVIHGTVDLETPGGTRISSDKTAYHQVVMRFVEVRTKAEVEVRGLPEGKQLLVYPSRVDLTLRYIFPRSGAEDAAPRLYVDYDEFSRSISGKCMIRSDGTPQGVVSFRVDPPVCECVEQ